jgi:DNA-binding XRE family transcriptional regulator
MLRDRPYDWPVITADELRDARNRAGYTSQAALAEALGVSERTVTNWEAEGGHVSTRAEAKVRMLLWPAPGPLSSYSNYELLSELGRRLDRTVRQPDYSDAEGEGHGDVSFSTDDATRHAGSRKNTGPAQAHSAEGPRA